ncbi:6340_t:CDS:2 [Racocetra fulgida]|uniref:6340_t:CDS:1 n=1 Tax=Racocetra fulgida TaxID=60492 RepID=A0A9N9IUQ6_9GLOM|nr:6340_t:CDS:2 [Racocetra fulgida]
MARGQKNPEITETRNGVTNYINFMKDFYPRESAFPVQVDYLKQYIDYKVKAGKLQIKYLKLYVTNIKAHNEALGFSWAFGAIIKTALVVVSSNLLPTDINSSNLNAYSLQSSDSLCNSQFRQSYDQNSSGINTLNVSVDNNIQANITQNDNFLYNPSPCDARPFLPAEISAPNIVPLPTGINSYIQLMHLRSNQFDTQHVIPSNNFPTVPTDNAYFLISRDERPFHSPGINASNNIPLHIDTQHTCIIPNNNFIYSQSFPDARPSLQPEINANFQNTFLNQLPNPNIGVQELEKQNFISNAWKQIYDSQRKLLIYIL